MNRKPAVRKNKGKKTETYAQRALRYIPAEGRTVEQIAADAAAMVRRERMSAEDYNSIYEEHDRISQRMCCIAGRENHKAAAECMTRMLGEQLVLNAIVGMLMVDGGGKNAPA